MTRLIRSLALMTLIKNLGRHTTHERNNYLMRQLHNHCMSCCVMQLIIFLFYVHKLRNYIDLPDDLLTCKCMDIPSYHTNVCALRQSKKGAHGTWSSRIHLVRHYSTSVSPVRKKITVIYSNVQVHCTYRGTTKNAKAQAALSWSNKRILSSFFPCVCC
jgi:hypothetical protein